MTELCVCGRSEGLYKRRDLTRQHIQLLIFREKRCCSHVVTGKENREVVFRKSNTKRNYWRRMIKGRWRYMVSDIRRGRTGSEYGKGEIDSKRY